MALASFGKKDFASAAAEALEPRKPTRREQLKLDQQAQHEIAAKREARRLEKNRARQKRFRIRMKAKTKPKPKPKLTMAALAKLNGVSRWTLPTSRPASRDAP
jgi:hypothetical protein